MTISKEIIYVFTRINHRFIRIDYFFGTVIPIKGVMYVHTKFIFMACRKILLTHSGRQIKNDKCCKIWSMPIFCGQILRLFIIGNLFINYDKAGMSSFWNKNMGMFPWEYWKMQFLSCFLKSITRWKQFQKEFIYSMLDEVLKNLTIFWNGKSPYTKWKKQNKKLHGVFEIWSINLLFLKSVNVKYNFSERLLD